MAATATLNPIAFQIFHKLLDGTPYGTVLEYILHEGEQALINFGRGKGGDILNAKADAITKKMVADGWEIGKPHPKTKQPLTAADLEHDIHYRLIRALGVPGGFVRDQLRDATDHALGAGQVGSVPPTPTVEWVRQVATADLEWWASLVPVM